MNLLNSRVRRVASQWLAFSASVTFAFAAQRATDAHWERSMVEIDVNRNQYEYAQPWAKRPQNVVKFGIVTGPHEILTTAEDFSDRTMVRLQKNGRGKWWNARVTWLDYHANLALVTSDDAGFWEGLKPAELALTVPDKDSLEIVRWKGGNLETRKIQFIRYFVDEARLSFVNCLQMELDANTGTAWPEAVVSDGKLAAITSGVTDKNLRAIPAAFIKGVLEEQKRGWRGLGTFPFYWQPTENPVTHQHFNLKGEPRGVVVIDAPPAKNGEAALRKHDIILQVDGFDIDAQGYYHDPQFGELILENLSTRRRFAGDQVAIKVWRDAKEELLHYRLPKAEYTDKLVPPQVFDSAPEYLILGGIVFQPLTGPFLRSVGSVWRLNYFDQEMARKDRPAYVVLSTVLPDAYNIGYQDVRLLVVEKVNGQSIHRLSELQAALQKPQDGYNVIEFFHTDSLRKMVLDAGAAETATDRVLQRYNIQKPANILSEGSGK